MGARRPALGEEPQFDESMERSNGGWRINRKHSPPAASSQHRDPPHDAAVSSHTLKHLARFKAGTERHRRSMERSTPGRVDQVVARARGTRCCRR